MKQRITYLVHDSEAGVDPSRLNVTHDSLTIYRLDAAKEHRLTLGLAEMPHEVVFAPSMTRKNLWLLFKDSHELRIRWASQKIHTTVSPFLSRTSPGLHVFFTPRKDSTADQLCPLLKEVFSNDLKCSSLKDSFSTPPILSDQFSMSAAYQYYHLLPSLGDLVSYIQQKCCSPDDPRCHLRATSLLSAASLDIDFDAISHAVTLTAFWDHIGYGALGSETVSRLGPTDSVEVGVLSNEKPTEPEELTLSGFLTVLGEDTKPSQAHAPFFRPEHPLTVRITAALKV
ncbi:hypothetical protein LTR28_010982, partial [Elasticomyces elasticus]